MDDCNNDNMYYSVFSNDVNQNIYITTYLKISIRKKLPSD